MRKNERKIVNRLTRVVLEDPAMEEWFLRELAEAPPEVRQQVARTIEWHLPAITRNLAARATIDGEAEAMRLVIDVLKGRLDSPEARRLLIEALGGAP